jgi:hypothetical protein
MTMNQHCEHIGDTSICSQERISIFKFPERLLEISFRDLIFHFVYYSNHLKDLIIRILWTLVMSFSDTQAMILTVILTVYQTCDFKTSSGDYDKW